LGYSGGPQWGVVVGMFRRDEDNGGVSFWQRYGFYLTGMSLLVAFGLIALAVLWRHHCDWFDLWCPKIADSCTDHPDVITCVCKLDPSSAKCKLPGPQSPSMAEVKIRRRAAWQQDFFFDQLWLGDLYQSSGFSDPVESYVWYFMALRSDRTYASADDTVAQMISAFGYSKQAALQQAYDRMSLDQQLAARLRIIYILSSRGAEGFVTLAVLHRSLHQSCVRDTRAGGTTYYYRYTAGFVPDDSVQQASDDECIKRGYQRMPDTIPASVILPNDAEALMYAMIAQKRGHPLAGFYVASIENDIINTQYLNPNGNNTIETIIAQQQTRAASWVKPFEFYPGVTAGGQPHSDESWPDLDQQRAYAKINERTMFDCIVEALRYRGYLRDLPPPAKLPPPMLKALYDGAVRKFQAAMGYDATGWLTSEQIVRLVQMTALDGDAVSQRNLGVMYTNGVGVPDNRLRAKYWFERAILQGDCQSVVFYKRLLEAGVPGIAQDSKEIAAIQIRLDTCRVAGPKP
jgi:uncharacterized protein